MSYLENEMLLFAFISGLCCGSGPNAFLPTANNNRKKETITVYPNNQPLTATGSLPVPSATKRKKKKNTANFRCFCFPCFLIQGNFLSDSLRLCTEIVLY